MCSHCSRSPASWALPGLFAAVWPPCGQQWLIWPAARCLLCPPQSSPCREVNARPVLVYSPSAQKFVSKAWKELKVRCCKLYSADLSCHSTTLWEPLKSQMVAAAPDACWHLAWPLAELVGWPARPLLLHAGPVCILQLLSRQGPDSRLLVCRWERSSRWTRTASFQLTCCCCRYQRALRASAMWRPSTWMGRATSKSKRAWSRPRSWISC